MSMQEPVATVDHREPSGVSFGVWRRVRRGVDHRGFPS
jgi:hypothetical protein